MYEWLEESDYQQGNVAVFDFYNVLTGPDNHHRFRDGKVEHIAVEGMNTAYYPTAEDDDHPSPEGNRKATEEFVPLLNTFFHRWQSGSGDRPWAPSAPEESQLPAEGQGSPASNLIDDFEGGPPDGSAGWEAYAGEDLPTPFDCAPSSDAAHEGRASLQLDLDVPTGS